MLAGGMPKAMVQSIVGHLSDEMTERYSQPDVDMLCQLQQIALENQKVLTADLNVAQNVSQSEEQSLALAATR